MTWPSLARARTVELNPQSKPSMEVVTKWLHDCDSMHNECSQQPAVLPRRVIDVGRGQGCTEIHVFESHGERVPCIALSHPWGLSIRTSGTALYRCREH